MISLIQTHELVLQELFTDPARSYVRVQGRRVGWGALLLQMIGLDPTIRLEFSAEEVLLTSTSLDGKRNLMMPLSRISAVECGYIQSVRSLIIAVTLGMLCVLANRGYNYIAGSGPIFFLLYNYIAGSGPIFFLLAIVFFANFIFSRRIHLGMTSGMQSTRLAFRSGWVGGLRVDLAEAEAAVNVIQQALLQMQRAGLPHPQAITALAGTAPERAPAMVAGPIAVTQHRCHSCGLVMSEDGAFCDHCGAAVSDPVAPLRPG